MAEVKDESETCWSTSRHFTLFGNSLFCIEGRHSRAERITSGFKIKCILLVAGRAEYVLHIFDSNSAVLMKSWIWKYVIKFNKFPMLALYILLFTTAHDQSAREKFHNYGKNNIFVVE